MSILVQFKKKYIFELKIKNWIKWTTKMSKIWEKIWMRTYCKFLLLPFKCESQSGPEKNQMEREISSHCDKNSSHNIGANTDEHLYWINRCLSTYSKSQTRLRYSQNLFTVGIWAFQLEKKSYKHLTAYFTP